MDGTWIGQSPNLMSETYRGRPASALTEMPRVDRPFFSVVIPTRQRAETLRACLETCLAQDFDDYEILVVDNASTRETRAVVEAVGSERVRYLRSDRLLAMSANWELAVSEARGEYVTVVGDDDALMPYALRELARLVEEHGRPGAIRWSRAIWTWPTIAVQEDANCLILPMSRVVEWLDTREVIADVMAFRVGSDQLPMIYNSVIRRDVIDQVRDRCGSVFPTIYPDVYSGFALGSVAGRYLSVEVPMGIAGLGGRSNGVATLMQEDGRSEIANEFNSLNRESGYLPHPRVPDLTNAPVHIVDSFEHARDRLFPDDVDPLRPLGDDAALPRHDHLCRRARAEERGGVDQGGTGRPPRAQGAGRRRGGAARAGAVVPLPARPVGLRRHQPEHGHGRSRDRRVAACSRFVDAPARHGRPTHRVRAAADVHRVDLQRRGAAERPRAEEAERRAHRAVAKTRALRRSWRRPRRGVLAPGSTPGGAPGRGEHETDERES